MFRGSFVALLYFWSVSLRTRKILFLLFWSVPILFLLFLIWKSEVTAYVASPRHVYGTPSKTWDRNELMSSPIGQVDLVVSPEAGDVKRLVARLRNDNYGSRIRSVVFEEDQESMDEYIQEAAGKLSRGRNIILGVNVREISDTRLDYSIHHVPREMSWPMRLQYSMGPGPLYFRRSFYFNYFLPLQVAINEAYSDQYSAVNIKGWRLGNFPYPTFKSFPGMGLRLVLVYFALYLPLTGLLCLLVLLIVEEKRDGFKELLIINGAPRWLLDIHWLVCFALITFPVCLVVALIIALSQILVYMDGVLIFVIVTIFYWHVFSFIGLLMVFVQRPVLAIVIVLVVYWISPLLKFGLFGIGNCYTEFESANEMLNFSSAFKSPVSPSVGLVIILMVLSIILGIFLIIYLSPVFPGRYGVPKPWYSMCYKHKKIVRISPAAVELDQIQLGSKINTAESLSKENEVENSAMEGLIGASVGLRTSNLVKKYGRNVAVNDVSMVIPKNQNTVLLGHNGAGKTTLLSIFCGMTAADSGTWATDEHVIFSEGKMESESYKKEIGYCPQHNMLFSKATPDQHLILFGLLKGLSYAQARSRSNEVLLEFSLIHVKNRKAKKLSGGMQRKLCFCIALINNPPYLFLDEPTSGLDVVSRRFVCNSLLARKGMCTVVISTHSMEEAELLGDKIAIMAYGRLICFGSLLFLENRYEVGYKLSVNHDGNAPNSKLIVAKRVPAAKLLEESDHTVVFSIAPDNVDRFPALLRELDAAKFESALTYSALDDVFLKVQDQEGMRVHVDSIPTATDDEEKLQKVSVLQRIGWLFYLRAMWTLRKWKMTLFAFVVPPLFGLLVFMVLVAKPWREEEEDALFGVSLDAKLSMGMYEGSTVLMATRDGHNVKVANALQTMIVDSGLKYQVIGADEQLVDSLNGRAKEDLMSYRYRDVFAFDTREQPTAFFSLTSYHSAPIALNTLMNAFLAGKSEIVTRNIPVIITEQIKTEGPTDCYIVWLRLSSNWIVFFGIPMLLSSAYFVAFPRTDRMSFFKHLQFMTGVTTTTYWLTLLAWDMLLYSIVIIFLSFYLILFKYEWVAEPNALTMIGLLLLYGLGSISLCLLLSLLVDKTALAMLCLLLFLGAYAFVKIAELFNPLLRIWFLYFLPWVPFMEGTITVLAQDVLRNGCVCQGFPCLLFMKRAKSHVWFEMIVLLADAVLYMVIFLVISSYTTRRVWSQCRKSAYQKQEMNVMYDETRESDRSVRREKIRVDKLLKKPTNNQPYYDVPKQNDHEQLISASSQKIQATTDSERAASFICDNIGKMYSLNRAAVCDVTFAIGKGECFGLLGHNGSGKTTTFRILAGDLVPTKGEAVLGQLTLSQQTTMFVSQVGYCPQFNGLLYDLSADTLLKFYAGLRGTPKNKVKALSSSWTSALDMDGISRRPCGTYSGGNKRKLSLALGMLGNVQLVLLDEPTTGVDLIVTHRIWKIIKYSADANNLMVILSTHSMKECEAVCGRLTIMVNGVMKCLGTAPQLKDQLGARSSLHVQFRLSSSPLEINDMRRRIENAFKPHIRLLTGGDFSVTYSIDAESLKMYEVFSTMVKLKSTNPVIADFAAGDASLDQVFENYVK